MINLSLEDNLAFETLGILRPKSGAMLADPRLAKLTEVERQFLVELLMCGEHGMTRSKIKGIRADAQLTLDIMGYVDWERDNRGNPAYLVLTWKGQEVAEVLRVVSAAMTDTHQETFSPSHAGN